MRPSFNEIRFKTVVKKVYVAASMDAIAKARFAAFRRVSAGLTVTSRWIMDDSPIPPYDENQSKFRDHLDVKSRWAVRDEADIEASDTVLVLAEEQSSTGGYHSKLGLAIAKKKNILAICGPLPVNVFLLHPDVRRVRDLSDAVQFLMSHMEKTKT